MWSLWLQANSGAAPSAVDAQSPSASLAEGLCYRVSLTMTYFHTRMGTIIGAYLFHGPVRDGKGWDQAAMVVRL